MSNCLSYLQCLKHSILPFNSDSFHKLMNNTVLSGSVECFKHCKQLNRLLIKCKQISEDFFTNINIFLPKLQLIKKSQPKNNFPIHSSIRFIQ